MYGDLTLEDQGVYNSYSGSAQNSVHTTSETCHLRILLKYSLWLLPYPSPDTGSSLNLTGISSTSFMTVWMSAMKVFPSALCGPNFRVDNTRQHPSSMAVATAQERRARRAEFHLFASRDVDGIQAADLSIIKSPVFDETTRCSIVNL